MTENTETLILENLKAIRACQGQVEEKLRSIENRLELMDESSPPQ